jgi:hypothetical protein
MAPPPVPPLWVALVFFLVIVVVVVVVIDEQNCSSPAAGGCTSSRQCTSSQPCRVDLDGDGTADECIVGNMCTNSGFMCENNWFSGDCFCATVPGQAQGSCRVSCKK